MMRRLSFLLLAAAACASTPDATPTPTGANYYVYVGAESADMIHRVRFGPDGAVVDKTIPVGRLPTENEGPHGLVISPDGRFLYMTTGHGIPQGKIWKYELGPDTLVAPEIDLGLFPATLDVTPDGLFAFVVNFNLHGEHVPSSVSVVYTPDMIEVARTETCTMPHGSRLNPQGTRHYSACMMDDALVELDARDFQVARMFGLATGEEGPMRPHAEVHAEHMAQGGHDANAAQGGMGMQHAMKEPSCSPTWAEPSTDGSKVYVACNKSDRVHEIDVADWRITRTFTTGRAPYNLEATADGRLLVVTLKAGKAVEFIDIATGRSVATTPTSTTVVHGVVASPDSRYAFVTVEGVGAEPGKLDVYDLRTFERVASGELGLQAGGIAFWKMEPASTR